MSRAAPRERQPRHPDGRCANRPGRGARADLSSTGGCISPALPRRCKYEPTCSRYAVDAIREYGILRGSVLGVWRLLRCNPWSHGGYDPVEAQRVFKTGSDGVRPMSGRMAPRPAAAPTFNPNQRRTQTHRSHPAQRARPPKRMPIFANIIQQAFSPLISLFESIMVFIHAHLVGGSWGLAIVGLTVLIRAILVPVTFRQLKSMQEMQRLAPEMKAIKEKYNEDKQRQQQEIMKFYQENKINPLASCLPFALQLPVFISLFYMLRTDLKIDICGPQLREHYTRELHRPITSNSQIPEKAVHVMGQRSRG